MKPCCKDERWKTIFGFEGYYQISSCGRVKSLYRKVPSLAGLSGPCLRTVPEKIIKQHPDGGGYLGVNLHLNKRQYKKKVQRLVMETFSKRREGFEINHIDFDITNNHLKNLEWCTRLQNVHHSLNAGRFKIGEQHPMVKLNSKQVKEIRILYAKGGLSHEKIGKLYGVTHGTIGNITRGQTWGPEAMRRRRG